MPIQYLYPKADIISSSFNSNSGWYTENNSITPNLYNSIKAGIVSPNDATFIRASSYTFGFTQTYPYIFTLDDCNMIIASAELFLRASGYAPPNNRLLLNGLSTTTNNGNPPTDAQVLQATGSLLFDVGNNVWTNTKFDLTPFIDPGGSGGTYVQSMNVYISPIGDDPGINLNDFTIAFSEIELRVYGNYVSNNNQTTLYTVNFESGNSNIDLFISGNYQTFEKIPLNISGPFIQSGNIPLYINSNEPTGINDNLTLYTIGHDDISSGIDLFIRSVINTNMPLYINGFGGTSTQGITLFIKADDSGINYGSTNNTETLFIKSIPYTSGDCFDLFIAGPDSGYMYEAFPITIEGYGGSSTDITNLYIQALESGVDYGNNDLSLDLYLNAVAFNSGDPFSLYIGAPSSGYMNSDMPLYLNNLSSWTSLNSGMNLYVRTLESGNTGLNSPTLFIKTDESFSLSGDPFNLYISGYVGRYNNSSTLFIDGQGHFENTIPLFLSVAYESSANFSLFTTGWGGSGNKTTNLYINGYGGSSINTTTLYTYGPPPLSGEMLLFIEGGGTDFRTGDTTLYTYNNPDNDFINSINLYVRGGFEISELPLLVYNEYIPLISNKSATLFTNAFSGVLGKIGDGSTLYIDGTKPNDTMNLYLHNSGIHSLYGTYPLYLGGKDITYSGTANETTLYVHNQSEHINYGCDLLLYATQAYNDSGTFNLFIARNSEAIVGNTNLYLAATNGDTGYLGMSISGATYSNNNINLSIPYVESVVINNAKMYVHGF